MVALTYVALTLALIFFAIGASSLAEPLTEPENAPALVFTLAAALAIAALIRRELRRDPHQLYVFWLAAGPCVTGGGLIGAAAAQSFLSLGGVVFLLGASSTIWSIVELVRSHFAKDTIPDVLAARFPRDEIYEVAGVQLVCSLPDAEACAQGAFELQLFFQNCWDAERTVRVALTPRQGFFGLPGGADFPDADEPLTLGPCEAGILALPVVVTTPRALTIHLSVDVSGLGGHRVRKRRAQTIPMRVSRLATVLIAVATLGTHLVWGGGLRVKVPAGQRDLAAAGAPRRWRRIEAGEATAADLKSFSITNRAA